MGDRVLYCRTGRAEFHPVLSVSPKDPNADALIAAKKQDLIAESMRSGARVPEFKVEGGSTKADKE